MFEFENLCGRLHFTRELFNHLFALRSAQTALLAALSGSLVVLVRRDFKHVGDFLDNCLRGNVVLLVVSHLDGAAAFRSPDGSLHAWRYAVGVHDDLSFGVARRAADRLDEGAFRAQEAFLVGVENGDERNLRNVETLAQQVDAHEHIEFAEAQIADDLHALHRVNIVVHVPHTNADAFEIRGEILRHLFRQGRDKHTVSVCCAQIDLRDKIVDLTVRRPDADLRIEQTCRTDDLLHDLRGVLLFKIARGSAHEDCLVDMAVKLVEIQRTVVVRGGETETKVDERFFSCLIAGEHGTHLRQGYVRLVHKEEKILREIV